MLALHQSQRAECVKTVCYSLPETPLAGSARLGLERSTPTPRNGQPTTCRRNSIPMQVQKLCRKTQMSGLRKSGECCFQGPTAAPPWAVVSQCVDLKTKGYKVKNNSASTKHIQHHNHNELYLSSKSHIFLRTQFVEQPTEQLKMQFKTIAVLFTLAALGYTQDVDNNDIPQACRNVCQSVVQLTTDCDRRIDDDSVAYRDCICQAPMPGTTCPTAQPAFLPTAALTLTMTMTPLPRTVCTPCDPPKRNRH